MSTDDRARAKREWTKADRKRVAGALTGFRLMAGGIKPTGGHFLAEVPKELEAEAAARHLDFIANIRADSARKNDELVAHLRGPGSHVYRGATEEMIARLEGLARETRRDEARLRALAARLRAEGMPPDENGEAP